MQLTAGPGVTVVPVAPPAPHPDTPAQRVPSSAHPAEGGSGFNFESLVSALEKNMEPTNEQLDQILHPQQSPAPQPPAPQPPSKQEVYI